ncbi:hypothetical protein ACF0H5_011341 [Mactra antiquata]
MASNTRSYLVIAAIDFGTTYSGHAYALLNDLRKDAAQVAIRSKYWTNDLARTNSLKTSTSILFKPDKTFHSFGLEAEKNYADLADDDKHQGWRFFKHFKMMLYERTIRRNTKLKDDQGKSMDALEVFSAAIRYLKDDVMDTLKKRVTSIQDSEIKWVITVPAIWNYKAKQFMKEAAIQAGIDARQVCLAHEPEAAAIYCKHIEVCKAEDSKGNSSLECFKPGSQFMILDLGGGTVDISACEIQDGGSLKELCPRGGGPWGGTVVDAALSKKIGNVIGTEVMESFSKECTYDHLQLKESIELKKRMCGSGTASVLQESNNNTGDADVNVELPAALLTMYEEKHKETLATALGRSTLKPCMRRNRICFSYETFSAAFQEPAQNIITEIRSLTSKYFLHRLNTFMMVGGFSESPIIQKAVRDAFPEKVLIIPDETSTAVLKGAVLYGYQSSYIHSRILPYSFGISTSETYDRAKHRGAIVNYLNKVEDIFCLYVKKGTTVNEKGIEVKKRFINTSSTVEVFQTPADVIPNPAFTNDDNFERIGEVTFNSSRPGQTVDVKMKFGIFDIKVSARPEGSPKWTEETFDAL